MIRNRKSRHSALELRRFILAMYRARKWYMPRVTIKDVLREYDFKISEKTVRRAIGRLRKERYIDTWDAPPTL